MSQVNDTEKRAEMLRLRDFYASRMMPNGPVKIREVGAFRAGFYIGRVIQSIGGTDLSNQSDEEVYALLTREIESSSSPNAGTTSHHCVTHPHLTEIDPLCPSTVANAVPRYWEIVFRPRTISANTRAANAAAHALTQGTAHVLAMNAASHARTQGTVHVLAMNAASHARTQGTAHVLAMNAASHARTQGTARVQATNAASHARRREDIAIEQRQSVGYEDNFVLPVRQCNPYYKNPKFVKSNQDNDWHKAVKSDKYFGFRRVPKYESLQLFWNRSCPNCGCRYLNSQSDSFITKCCRASQEMSYPPERRLTPMILKAIKEDPAHMSCNATTYNNILAFGATCVENDCGGGFQTDFRGPHSVTIKGKTYHSTHKQYASNPTSGLGVMFFENSKNIASGMAKVQNNRRSGGKINHTHFLLSHHFISNPHQCCDRCGCSCCK